MLLFTKLYTSNILAVTRFHFGGVIVSGYRIIMANRIYMNTYQRDYQQKATNENLSRW